MLAPFESSILVPENGFHFDGGGFDPSDDEFAVYATLKAVVPEGRRRLGWSLYDEPLRNYDPFREEPALFLLLAALDRSPESIVRFANKYGTLHHFIDDGCLLSDWRDAIVEMGAAVDLGQAIKSRDSKRMMKHVTITGSGQAQVNGPLGDLFIRRQLEFRSPKEKSRTTELVSASLQVLRDLVNQKTFGFAAVCPVVAGDALLMRVEISTIEAVAWIQLALFITEDKEYRNCENCGKPFKLSPEANRADRVFCKDSCRVSAYRRRRKHAAEMRQRGETLCVIAKELQSDVSTIKAWLNE